LVALTVALLGLALPTTAQADPAATPASPQNATTTNLSQPPTSPWAATLELYGFAPIHTTGSTTVRGFTADTDLWIGDLIPMIQMTASARGSLEKGRFGLLADLSYNRIGDNLARTTPRGLLTGKATVTTNLGLYDIALRYRFGDRESAVANPGSWSVIPYAGLRLVDTGLSVNAQIQGNGRFGLRLQREGNLSLTLAQPLLGTQASVFLSPRLRAFGRADLGGFGLTGAQDLSGNAQVGLGYAIGNNTDLNLSWRYMGLAFDNGASRPNGFTTYQNGLEVGVKVFF
jgi:hypothetical protein